MTQHIGSIALLVHHYDFWRDYRLYVERGVSFNEQPRKEPYGTVAVFTDCLGNTWDLIEFA